MSECRLGSRARKGSSGRLAIAAWVALAAISCERAPDVDDAWTVPVAPVPNGDPRLPGVARVDAGLQRTLDRALAAQPDGYVPRTHHVRDDGEPRFTNRLIFESSPYLLQHAHNPVNWFAWSEEAFARAKQENKPVFLSVGYSTCHWCHVMERESFEDEEIAAFLNRHFIAIKVDREERPDVDSVYMTAVQLLTGRGGWPMTVIMTPEKEPFFGGTYFPPRKGVRGARVGLIDILADATRVYGEQPSTVAQRAQELSRRIARVTITPPSEGVPSDRVIFAAAERLSTMYDAEHGGFGGAPKFPQPGRLALLLRFARRTGDSDAIAMVTHTLNEMAAGGIHDHVGGGFHRYATDARWLVPHFEKMLYDNAQLAVVYLEAWQATSHGSYERVARDILDYVVREMTSPEGAFYSATDADSPTPDGHDEEGYYFTWTTEEVEALLDARSAAAFVTAYGLSPGGNFEGRNILHRVSSDAEVAAEIGIAPSEVEALLEAAKSTLYDARASRPAPIRDEKIIAAWNGLMVSALARGGWVLDEPRYVDAAKTAAELLLGRMRRSDGRLARTFKDGKIAPSGFLDDYAFTIAGLLDLYEATGDSAWLRHALTLQQIQDRIHLDPRDGGYFMTADDAEALLVREKPAGDGAIPSGNSVAALNLLRLYELTENLRWKERAEALLASLGSGVERAPVAYPWLLVALDFYYDVPFEVALVSDDEPRPDRGPLAERLRRSYVPNKVFSVLSEEAAKAQEPMVPWLEGKRALGGKATAYVCERGRCELPTSDPAVFAEQIGKRRPYPRLTHAR